jgi:hypothetical protein
MRHLPALLLFSPALALAAAPPPVQLDDNGVAHFNIPFEVQFARPGGAKPHKRDESDAEDSTTEEQEPVDAPRQGRFMKLPPVQVEPEFEINHQGQPESEASESDDASDEYDADLKPRAAEAAPNPVPAPAADVAIPTHTILLIETTGTATSTTDQNITTSANLTATNIPPPLNHTSFPLRNGTNSTLPCNGTEQVIVKTANVTGTGTPTMPVNPANAAKASSSVVKAGGVLTAQVPALLTMAAVAAGIVVGWC